MSKARDSVEDLKTLDANLAAKLPKSGGALTGAVTTNSTFDGVAIATRDGILTSTTATANAALPKAGGTMAGDTIHGDNVKAKFGTGGDLEIYHDGSHSRIKDVGTGNLSISASARIGLDASNGDNMGAFNEAGSVQLFHNGSQKLATTSTGVDVTGTVTADGLGVSGNSSPNVSVTSTGGSVTLWSGADDAAGYVGTQSNHPLVLRTNQTERMRIDTSGRVGIGTASPAGTLQVVGPTGAGVSLSQGSENFYAGSTHRFYSASYAAERMRIDSSGKVGIGRTPTASYSKLEVGGADNTALINAEASGVFAGLGVQSGGLGLYVNNSNKMTINSSGAVMVGKTTTGFATTGVSLIAAGEIDITASGGAPLFLRRNSSNGTIQAFYRDATAVGSISVTGSATAYNTSSDYRLKTDVQPMTGATATFMQLKPCNFEWIADGTRVDGFLAHELGEVIPAAATGSKDAMKDEEYEVTPATGDVYTAGSDAGFNEVSSAIEASPAYYDVDGNVIKAEVVAVAAVHEAFDSVDEVIHSSDVEQPETLEDGQQWRETTAQVMATRSVPDMQGIDQAKVVPLLVATIQELIARVEALEVVG